MVKQYGCMVKPFTLNNLSLIQGWLKARDLDINLNDLPSLGMTVYVDGDPIACAFIREIEGDGYGLLDSLVSDPSADAETRDLAIDILVHQLMRDAKSRGFKRIIALSLDNNTLLRSNKHGFVRLAHAPIALAL